MFDVINLKFLWPSFVLKYVAREDVVAMLKGLELFMHVSQQILLELIDSSFHQVPHHVVLIWERRFLNFNKIVFAIKDLCNIFRDGDSQLAVLVPYVIVEVGFDIHDLFEMVQSELFGGLLGDHSADPVKHETFTIFVKNIHGAIDERLELEKDGVSLGQLEPRW